ncbi:unnamed protein product [Arctogadus glacialis]
MVNERDKAMICVLKLLAAICEIYRGWRRSSIALFFLAVGSEPTSSSSLMMSSDPQGLSSLMVFSSGLSRDGFWAVGWVMEAWSGCTAPESIDPEMATEQAEGISQQGIMEPADRAEAMGEQDREVK